MSYTLSLAGGDTTVAQHDLTVYALGDRAIVTLTVVDDEETPVIAFSYTSPGAFDLDATGEYMAEVSKLYDTWRESVGAVKSNVH